MWRGHWNLPEWCGPRFLSSTLPAVKIVSCQPGPRPLVGYAVEISAGEAKYAHSFSSWTRPCWAKVKSVADIAYNAELTEDFGRFVSVCGVAKGVCQVWTRTPRPFVRIFEWSTTGLWLDCDWGGFQNHLKRLPGSSEEASGSSQEVSMIIWVVSRITCLPGSSVWSLTVVKARSCLNRRTSVSTYR